MKQSIIWDADWQAPLGEWKTVLWRGYLDHEIPDAVSIPRLVEEDSSALRSRYLELVYELGEIRFNNARLIDCLELHEGFSYWWMNLLAIKCNYAKSPQIENLIKMFAFADWASDKNFNKIILHSANRRLADCFHSWCKQSGVDFEWCHLPDQAESLSWARRLYKVLPHTLRALAWLLNYLYCRWPLRGVGLDQWLKTEGRTTFITYSDNLVETAQKKGLYESRYWGNLPVYLKNNSYKTNWLHLYIEDGILPKAKDAVATIEDFNSNGKGLQCHVTLETFLGIDVVFNAMNDWVRLVWCGLVYGRKLRRIQRGRIYVWPLLKGDWQESMFGAQAMCNALHFNLFNSALGQLPEQHKGVYLQENQGWEFGMIHAWYAAGHARLIGAPHSTVRFWDLSYFYDPRTYVRTERCDLPMPDLVACNGSMMKASLLSGGYPEEKLVGVEALRYLHLDKIKEKLQPNKSERNRQIRLLVLGDYVSKNTKNQLMLLAKAIPHLPQPPAIFVKPHPNCPIRSADYPSLNMEVTMEPIDELLVKCDIAYSSALTSAAVDAYCTGMPTISVLDPTSLNLSPLRGREGLLFVTTSEDLTNALITMSNNLKIRSADQDFFTTDPRLLRWRQLLSL